MEKFQSLVSGDNAVVRTEEQLLDLFKYVLDGVPNQLVRSPEGMHILCLIMEYHFCGNFSELDLNKFPEEVVCAVLCCANEQLLLQIKPECRGKDSFPWRTYLEIRFPYWRTHDQSSFVEVLGPCAIFFSLLTTVAQASKDDDKSEVSANSNTSEQLLIAAASEIASSTRHFSIDGIETSNDSWELTKGWMQAAELAPLYRKSGGSLLSSKSSSSSTARLERYHPYIKTLRETVKDHIFRNRLDWSRLPTGCQNYLYEQFVIEIDFSNFKVSDWPFPLLMFLFPKLPKEKLFQITPQNRCKTAVDWETLGSLRFGRKQDREASLLAGILSPCDLFYSNLLKESSKTEF